MNQYEFLVETQLNDVDVNTRVGFATDSRPSDDVILYLARKNFQDAGFRFTARQHFYIQEVVPIG